jgi:hypothetical protein
MDEKTTDKEFICKCPYCDAEIKLIGENCAICEPCSITIITCESCGGKAKEGAEKCPACGEPLHG